MQIQYLKGDLFAHLSDYKDKILIPHVVNDAYIFGGGFTAPLGKIWPIVKKQYFEKKELILGETQFISVEPRICVANMVAQVKPYTVSRPLVYGSLYSCMKSVGAHAYTYKETIVAPKFGAGLAGGDWDIIEELINEAWIKQGRQVYIYSL